MNYKNSDFLISPADLQAASANPTTAQNLRIFDVTVFLKPAGASMTASSGIEPYQSGHVPGAAFIDQLTDLSVSGAPYRFTLPNVAELTATFAQLGINANSQVVLYTTGHVMWATRAWWLLRYCGHEQVAILDGGYAGWQAQGFDTSTPRSQYAATTWTPTPRANMFADIDEVAAATTSGSHCTINALPAAMYDGSSPIHYGRPGHIPHSDNLPYEHLLQQTQVNGHTIESFAAADELTTVLAGVGLLDERPAITYCGGGIAATVDGFACALVGKMDVAVYDGSMSEWASDPSRSVVL